MGHEDPIALLRIELRERLQQCLDRWLIPATTTELKAGAFDRAERTFLCGNFKDVDYLDTTTGRPVALWMVSNGLEADAGAFVEILKEELTRQPDLLSCYGIDSVWSVTAAFKWVQAWFEPSSDNLGVYYSITGPAPLRDEFVARGNGHVWRTPLGVWYYKNLLDYFKDRDLVPVGLYNPLKSAIVNNLPQTTPTYISRTRITGKPELASVADPVYNSITESRYSILKKFNELFSKTRRLARNRKNCNTVLDPRLASWESVRDKPLFFTPVEHIFDADQMVGMDAVVEATDRIS